MLKPKYYGTVEPTQMACFCKQQRGKVWMWIPRVPGVAGMPAHTKCFRSLWKGDY